MNKRESIAVLLLAFSATAATGLVAQAPALETAPGETQDTLERAADELREPTQRIAKDPVVFNGGISLEERASAPDEGTKLEFFLKGGPYVSDVHVEVKDSEGNAVVNTVTEGPWLILDLPDGEYQVHASLNADNAQGGRITVDSRSEEFGYMFPTL